VVWCGTTGPPGFRWDPLGSPPGALPNSRTTGRRGHLTSLQGLRIHYCWVLGRTIESVESSSQSCSVHAIFRGCPTSCNLGSECFCCWWCSESWPAWHHEVLSQQWLSMAVVFQTERCLHISIESMRAVEMKHVVHGILFISCFTCFHMYPQTLDTDCIFVDVPFDMEATESFGFCVTTDHRLSMINVGCTIVNIIYDIH
jgi:hypothetical protein